MKAPQEGDQKISFDDYHPKDWPDVLLMAADFIPVPDQATWQPDQIAEWKTVMNGHKTTIISNLAHRDYPGTYCQVQMSLDGRQFHVFMTHAGPREKHIREEIVDRIFQNQMLPQIIDEFLKIKPK